MPGLDREVPGDEVVDDTRLDGDGDEGRGAGDQAVDHGGHAVRGGAEVAAGEHADLEAADGSQQAHSVGEVGTVDLERSPDGAHLLLEAFVVDTGATAGDGARWAVGHCTDDGGGGRRVADAHLAERDDIDALTCALGLEERDAGRDCALCEFARHRRTPRDVRRAGTEAQPEQPRVLGRLAGDAGVDDPQPRASLSREHGDRRASREEVRDHLRRDFLRVRGHALDRHAVVGRRDHDQPPLEARTLEAGDRREADRKLLEAPERAGRLREAVLPRTRGPGGALIERPDRSGSARDQRSRRGSVEGERVREGGRHQKSMPGWAFTPVW